MAEKKELAKDQEKEIKKIEQVKEEPAKAGKRSLKAIKEKEALAEKEERKKKTETKEESTKVKVIPKTKPKSERRSKKYKEAYKTIDHQKQYSLVEALKLAKNSSTTKFDASVELHINLNVDPRHADQNIRDNIVLPAGSGKSLKVAVYVEDAENSKDIKADQVGGEELLQKIDKGTIDFDVLITTPAMMPKLARYAKVLGPKGLMPNPKSGTVTNDLAKACLEAKSGKVEYRVDSNGIVHINIGKVSFKEEDLLKNAESFLTSLKSNKPSSIKGAFIKSIFASTTMGPSVKIDPSNI